MNPRQGWSHSSKAIGCNFLSTPSLTKELAVGGAPTLGYFLQRRQSLHGILILTTHLLGSKDRF